MICHRCPGHCNRGSPRRNHQTNAFAIMLRSQQPFQHILRLLNTNIDGKRKIQYALTEIKGVGRRYANVVCKKADVDLAKRWVDSTLALASETVACVSRAAMFEHATMLTCTVSLHPVIVEPVNSTPMNSRES